jgi:transcriptional regulator with XRE-family HTH domain
LDSPTCAKPSVPQTGRRTLRNPAAYALLRDLYEHGEDLAEATARCSPIFGKRQAETLVGLHHGALTAPRLSSDGVATIFRFHHELADYMVERTPDPRQAHLPRRPIPAELVREALTQSGYATERVNAAVRARSHQALADATAIDRRTISRICSGERKNLTIDEADAILHAIGRDELYRELVEPLITDHAATLERIEEELEEIYEFLWFACATMPIDGRRALEDLHWLYQDWQHKGELARLPFPDRREATTARFTAHHDRKPHPIPTSLRNQALKALADRRKRYLEEAKVLHRTLGSPDRVTAAWVRDTKHRAVGYGAIDGKTVRPNQYAGFATQACDSS